ncbi:MAG: RsmB/NOP family class I SAM-dependent RNA methyltransferase [Synergistaceae bacterium]|jgi:16S rRNA (cytosine967-C5)-methyltransferase|nr:RsmB/NOP family class I SAM-dependent RNA methyltransferase [Synergistaceae bacterium]
MRGIEGALLVLSEVENGAFAAESIRRAWENIVPSERSLTTTLVYITLRKLGLWKHLLMKYCKRPVGSLHPKTVSVLLPGIAGVIDLKHFKPGVLVNALVQQVKDIKDKSGAPGEAALVNAVLHTVMEHAPAYIDSLMKAPAMRDQALACGVPGWAAAEWSADWGMKVAKHLVALSAQETYMSLRASPGVDRVKWSEGYGESAALPSVYLSSSIRVESNPYPPALPGYSEGLVTPQGESSMWAVESLLANWSGGKLLDMCAGRGVKSGHILSFMADAEIEGWDISQAKVRAAEREMRRLRVHGRAEFVPGDALTLTPKASPSAILLDAPCSGSGTWGRHPEGKWRMSREKLKRAADLQMRLFSRAVDLLSPGGIIIYCTCSVFREENEQVVGAVLAKRSDLVELPLKSKWPFREFERRGKPYGTVVFPETPWTDGFYAVLFRKKH